jgi:hypothetical protein
MTTKFNAEVTDRDIKSFLTYLVPFGSSDIHAAIEHAINAGHDADWAAEQIEDFMDQCDVKIDDIDPVYCVMESILQEARGEIEQETGFDLCNDAEQGEIHTYGNYMCSSYDYKEEAKQELINVLAKHDIEVDDLSENTQYFLDQCEISQEDINAAKTEEAEEE